MRSVHLIPLLLSGLLAAPAFAAPQTGELEEATLLLVLESVYLQCDRESRVRLLGFGEAAHCSQVAEELLRRRFGGDFRRLIAWWQSQRDDPVAFSDTP